MLFLFDLYLKRFIPKKILKRENLCEEHRGPHRHTIKFELGDTTAEI